MRRLEHLIQHRFLQVADSLRTQNVNRKGARIVEAENPAGERDFGHVRGRRRTVTA